MKLLALNSTRQLNAQFVKPSVKTVPFTSYDTENNIVSPEKNPQPQNKKKLAVIAAGVLGAFTALITSFKKFGASSRSAKTLKKLIKTLKPTDVDLAKEIYPVLIKNSEQLGIKPEHFNAVMGSVNKNNKQFMIQEGFDLISSKMEKLKKYVFEPVEDLSDIVKSLNAENKVIFNTVVENPQKYMIENFFEISMFLQKLNPSNYDYMFNKLVPMLSQYKQPLKLNSAEHYVNLLSHINPKTEKYIPQVAASYSGEAKNLDKYKIILNMTDENKDCVIPLIKNSQALGLDSNGIINALRTLKNENSFAVEVIGQNFDKINKLALNPDELLKLISDEQSAKSVNFILKNSEVLNSKNISDIEFLTKKINPEKFDFYESSLLPKLSENKELFEIDNSEDVVDILNNITAETLESVDIIAKYAKKSGKNLSYSTLLKAVTKENMKNLDGFLADADKSELWQNFMVDVEDFKKVLNKE